MLTINGKLDFAQKAFNDALALDRSSTEDYGGYVYFLIATRNLVEGLRLAKRHLDAHVIDLRARIRYAEALAAADQVNESLTILEKAAEMEPGHSQVHLHLAQMYIKMQQPREALRHLEHARLLVDKRTLDAVVVSCEKLFQSWPDEVKRQWSERGLVTADRDSFPPPSLLVTEG